MINLIFIAWLAYSGYRGYRAGWLSMLLGLAAFTLAYIVCFLGTEALANAFRERGLNALYAFGLAGILLFAGTSFLVATLPRWILVKTGFLRRDSHSFLGAALGIASGLVSGLLVLWAFGLIKVALALPSDPGPIEKQANKLVGSVAELGVEVSGAEGIKAEATKALFKDPATFMTSLKSLAESKELKNFVNDKNIQKMMSANDIDGLLKTPGFKSLSEHEGFQMLLKKQTQAENFGKRELAENMTQVWQRMQALKYDPEIQSILGDEEVKKLIEQNNPVTLLNNKKIQRLIDRVMEVDLSKIDHSASENAEDEIQTATREQAPIFEWHDDNGNIKFSDFQSIPPDKREQARQVGGKINE